MPPDVRSGDLHDTAFTLGLQCERGITACSESVGLFSVNIFTFAIRILIKEKSHSFALSFLLLFSDY